MDTLISDPSVLENDISSLERLHESGPNLLSEYREIFGRAQAREHDERARVCVARFRERGDIHKVVEHQILDRESRDCKRHANAVQKEHDISRLETYGIFGDEACSAVFMSALRDLLARSQWPNILADLRSRQRMRRDHSAEVRGVNADKEWTPWDVHSLTARLIQNDEAPKLFNKYHYTKAHARLAKVGHKPRAQEHDSRTALTPNNTSPDNDPCVRYPPDTESEATDENTHHDPGVDAGFESDDDSDGESGGESDRSARHASLPALNDGPTRSSSRSPPTPHFDLCHPDKPSQVVATNSHQSATTEISEEQKPLVTPATHRRQLDTHDQLDLEPSPDRRLPSSQARNDSVDTFERVMDLAAAKNIAGQSVDESVAMDFLNPGTTADLVDDETTMDIVEEGTTMDTVDERPMELGRGLRIPHNPVEDVDSSWLHPLLPAPDSPEDPSLLLSPIPANVATRAKRGVPCSPLSDPPLRPKRFRPTEDSTNSQQQVFVHSEDHPLAEADVVEAALDSLATDGLVNASAISLVMEALNPDPSQNVVYDGGYLSITDFAGNGRRSLRRLEKYGRWRRLFFVLHHSNPSAVDHWTLGFVDRTAAEYGVYDPLPTQAFREASVMVMRSFLPSLAAVVPKIVWNLCPPDPRLPRQSNATDCGVLIMIAMLSIVYAWPSRSTPDVKLFRSFFSAVLSSSPTAIPFSPADLIQNMPQPRPVTALTSSLPRTLTVLHDDKLALMENCCSAMGYLHDGFLLPTRQALASVIDTIQVTETLAEDDEKATISAVAPMEAMLRNIRTADQTLNPSADELRAAFDHLTAGLEARRSRSRRAVSHLAAQRRGRAFLEAMLATVTAEQRLLGRRLDQQGYEIQEALMSAMARVDSLQRQGNLMIRDATNATPV